MIIILTLNSHSDQFGNSRGMIDDSSCLKLWSPFSATLLKYAESQNFKNSLESYSWALIALMTTWPLRHIWHMWFFPPWNTFPSASGQHSVFLLGLCVPFLNLLLGPHHVPDLWVSQDSVLQPLLSGVLSLALNIMYTHKTFKWLSLFWTYQQNSKLLCSFYLPQYLEWSFKTLVKSGCYSPPNPPMTPYFLPCQNHLSAVAYRVLGELALLTIPVSSHSAAP